MKDLLEELKTIVGSNHVQTTGDLLRFEEDWRKRNRGKALAVVSPKTTEEVAQIVKACVQANVSIVPQGGNTSMVVGAIPNESGTQVLLSLQRMNEIRSIDAENLTIVVDSGCVLQNVQLAAEKVGFLFPLSLGSQGSCTIGGNLSTNAGGTQVVRYGNARELCLGLEVVTASGDIWHGLTGLRKDNTGYDLRNLYIGSEGTLGIITAATLKLYPLPAAKLTAWAAVPNIEKAVKLLGLAHQTLGPALSGFEMMGQFALGLVDQHFPQLRVPLWKDSAYCVLLEASDSESESHARAQFETLMQTAFSDEIITDAVIAESIAQAKALWLIRENITMAQAAQGLNIKHDISIPVSRIAEFVEHTDALITQKINGAKIVNFGHLGDGNLHYNVQAPLGLDHKDFLKIHEHEINTLVYDCVKEFGGSISAEHGVGSLKVETLKHYKDPTALHLMRLIKGALDPKNLMNPGRVIQPE
jgi:FAD/FMN-containing dehydrogenase